MALLIKVDGSGLVVNAREYDDSRPSSNDKGSLSFSLNQLQKFVGGCIQSVYPYNGKPVTITSTAEMKGGKVIPKMQNNEYVFAYANEEGLIEQLTFNPVASSLLRQPLVGDILFLTQKEFEDD